MPRFGPMCQYEFDYYNSDHSFLQETIHDFYRFHKSTSTNLTCYAHLQCNYALFLTCLDWSDICDGKIDCLDDASDEEHCWQLEINKCKDNEYRCINGQCIPQSFFPDDPADVDCIDGSDRTQCFHNLYVGRIH